MRTKLLLVLLTFALLNCSQKESGEAESWINKPISDWPNIVMTNVVKFENNTYNEIANSFLVTTGLDTFAVTAKHLFMVFRQNGLETIDLGDKFISWHIFPKGQNENRIELAELINANEKEKIGQFNTLKDRDWIVFRIKKKHTGIYPLKIRKKPVSKGEIVRAVGWAKGQDTKEPSVIEMKVFKNMGNYFYVQTLTKNVNPVGRSGSPVIDKNGFLVGLISGAEGKLGVIGSVDYLKNIFNAHGISFTQ